MGQAEGHELLDFDKVRPTHRFTLRGVKVRTGGLGLLGNKLAIDLFTGIFHALVIGGYISAIHLYLQEK